jgi:hypothetical protein
MWNNVLLMWLTYVEYTKVRVTFEIKNCFHMSTKISLIYDLRCSTPHDPIFVSSCPTREKINITIFSGSQGFQICSQISGSQICSKKCVLGTFKLESIRLGLHARTRFVRTWTLAEGSLPRRAWIGFGHELTHCSGRRLSGGVTVRTKSQSTSSLSLHMLQPYFSGRNTTSFECGL